MKNFILFILVVFAIQLLPAQNYSTQLKAVNDFLKTFDNGYYGYLEIKDGYLYDRFKSGEHSKAPIKDMDKAAETETGKKVVIKCKPGSSCVFSTYTNSYHETMSFSQSASFNTQQLISLLNNLLDAYNGKMTTSNTVSSSVSSTVQQGNYQAALKAVNDYVKILDGDRYQGLEIKDGYLYSNYKNGNYSRAKVEDIDQVVHNKEFKYVKLTCKNDAKCIYSTITGSYHDYFNFQSSTGKDLNKMTDLLNNFVKALKGGSSSASSKAPSAAEIRAQKERELKSKSTTSTTDEEEDYFGYLFDEPVKPKTTNTSSTSVTSTNPAASQYATALKNLNDYLRLFNASVYKDVEVKDGKVLFKFFVFGSTYISSISIEELTKNTIIIKGKSVGSINDDEIKILCKNESDCFYSEYSKGMTDHFRFYSNTVKDMTKMKQVVEEFVNALK